MAFDSTNLVLLSQGNSSGSAPRLWAYSSSADTTATCSAVNYFRAASGTGAVGGLRAGDVILVRGSDGATTGGGIVMLSTVTTAASTGLKVTSGPIA